MDDTYMKDESGFVNSKDIEKWLYFFDEDEDKDFSLNLEDFFSEEVVDNHDFEINLGHSLKELDEIQSLLKTYVTMSESIADIVRSQSFSWKDLIQAMRNVKKEILKIISNWFIHCTYTKEVLENFLPQLFSVVLTDYLSCPEPSAREPEVLSTMTTIVNRLQEQITPDVLKIFDHVFLSTLSMINKDFEEFPEHRTNFFLLLQAVVNHCFPALLEIPPDQFKLVLDSIIWALKHTMRNVADIGLQILYQLLQNIGKDEDSGQAFYQIYYTDILQHLFSVVTDPSHTAGLSMQANILAYMFSIVESGKITLPLNPAVQGDTVPNLVYIQQFVADLLKRAFGHMSDAQIKITVSGFFNLDQDIPAFKEHLRDFLVQNREQTGAMPAAKEEEIMFRSMPMIIATSSDPKLSSSSSSNTSLFAGSIARYSGFRWVSKSENVSTDKFSKATKTGAKCVSCLNVNRQEKHYKCLVCYDYDLCATCYEGGASTTRHSADHPMQCILTSDVGKSGTSEFFPSLTDSSTSTSLEEEGDPEEQTGSQNVVVDASGNQVICSICHCQMEEIDQKFIKAQCGHTFCKTCMNKKFSKNNPVKPRVCDICNKKITRMYNKPLKGHMLVED